MKKFLWIAAALLWITPAQAWAWPPVVEASAGAGYVGGVNQYEIGGLMTDSNGARSYPFPISRLEFPVDMFFLALNGQADIGNRWRVNASVKRNVTDPGSDMKDSDWIFGAFGGKDSQDIYSTSKMHCDAWILDLSTRCRFLKALHGQGGLKGPDPSIRYHLYAGLGFMHQMFQYDVYHLDQFYPQIPNLTHDVYAGTAILYDLTFDIPYLLLGGEVLSGETWSLELEGKASWFAHAEDKDQHVLRDKITRADSNWDGAAYMGRVRFLHRFRPRWFWEASGELLHLKVETESRGELPGTPPYTLEEVVESEQSSIVISAGYTF